jgi:EF hand
LTPPAAFGILSAMQRKSLVCWWRLALFGAAVMLPSCASGPDAFKEADRDGDGKLSRQELANVFLNAVYSAGDADGDSKITFKEWTTVDPKADKAAFALRDKDGDGAVTPAELKSYAEGKKSFDKLFQAIDTSKDGFVQRDEAKVFHENLSKTEGETEIEKLINYSKR